MLSNLDRRTHERMQPPLDAGQGARAEMGVRWGRIMKLHRLNLLAGGLLAVFLLAACGKSEPAHDHGAADGPRLVRITGNDQMRFSLSEIKVAPGEEFRLMFMNVGRMPKETMGHNWVLFKQMPESDLNRLAMEAAGNSPGYLPNDRSVILAKTQILGPGQSETITLTAPAEPGEYVFACTFPGHFALMRGKLIVE